MKITKEEKILMLMCVERQIKEFEFEINNPDLTKTDKLYINKEIIKLRSIIDKMEANENE